MNKIESAKWIGLVGAILAALSQLIPALSTFAVPHLVPILSTLVSVGGYLVHVYDDNSSSATAANPPAAPAQGGK